MTQLKTIDNLVRPNIRALKPYRCARDDYETGVLLDANENAYGSVVISQQHLNRYPDPHQKVLKTLIGGWRGVGSVDNIFTGNGSDEAIDLLIRVFCVPGNDLILTCPPTYGMYKVSAAINDVGVLSVGLDSAFQLNVDEVIRVAVANPVKIIFLCSPGNPTGTLLRREDVVKVVEMFAGIVVVDEAYIDYALVGSSMASDVMKYENLVVLQTLSKSFGLAGIRLGVAFGSTRVIHYLNAAKPPYNVSTTTSDIAIKAFSAASLDRLQQMVSDTVDERKRLVDVYPGIPNISKVRGGTDANFLLVKVKSPTDKLNDNQYAEYMYKSLANAPTENIVTRFRGTEPQCEGCLRITIGTRPENDLLLSKWCELTQKEVNFDLNFRD